MPNFGPFQNHGFDFTEAETKPLEAEVIQVYRNSQKAIEAQLEKVYAQLAGIDSTDSGYYNYMVKKDRLENLLSDVSRGYTAFSTQAGRITATSSKIGVTNNYYRQLFASTWAVNVKFGIIPDGLVELATYGTKKAWDGYTESMAKKYGPASFYQPKEGTLSAVLRKNNAQQLADLRQVITQGLIEGKSYTKMVNDVKGVIGREIVKDGAKTLTGAKASAMRVLRTEGTRVMNSGAFAQSNYLQSTGVEVQKEWLATLDVSTRDRHAALDGQRVDVDKPFKSGSDTALYPGDFGAVGLNVNCRCATMDIIPGFEPDTRIGRNPVTGKNEVFNWKNYDQWAKDNGLVRSKSGRMVFK